LESILSVAGSDVAGIITEVPSNPQIQTPDVPKLRKLANRAGCALVLDSTIGTPHNVEVLPYADVVCESLTKYAAGSADVLMGTSIVNPDSQWSEEVIRGIKSYAEAPYIRDIERMAHRIRGYSSRIHRVNSNTEALVEYFSRWKIVRRVYWAYDEQSRDHYRRLERGPHSPSGLLLLDLAIPLEKLYDRLPRVKGPSFGAEFTMVSPQMFFAHYDLLTTEKGREILHAHRLHRNMLRISVGTEELDRITAAFDEGLRYVGR
jgi:cystathionine beta-lyase/cystathionine gamma-synthase